MAKPKKKLTAAQRAARKQRKKDFMIVFMNGKQVCVRRPPTTGLEAGEFIRRNADPISLHQHGDYELLEEQSQGLKHGVAVSPGMKLSGGAEITPSE